MKKYLIPVFLCMAVVKISAQQVLTVKNGGSVIIQNGVEITLQGGITLENGSSLLNNGAVRLKNNAVANISDWIDNSSAGALTGNGWVIFNSINPQNFSGATNFYAVQINDGGLTINNNFSVSSLLNLINGKINTGNFYVFLDNNVASSLLNDATNPGYTQSWINGNFRRSITGNTNTYDFPVGNSASCNLLQFLNNNVTGANYLTASFGPKPGTNVGLNIIENSATYTAVNNGGVWWLVPNAEPSAGSYALHLYFNGFTGLVDNQFGILRRADESSNAADWMVPAGSLLEPLNGTGRKVSDGFARRFNISDFSQFGIGEFNLPTPCNITGQSQVCIGSQNNIFSAPSGNTSYLWSVIGATIDGSNTGQSVTIIAPNVAGTFTINLTTTLNGVTAQCSKIVTVTTAPVCEITGANELCALSTNNSYSGPANMTAYSWTASAGFTIVGSNTGSSVNITATTPGPQLLTLTATGIGGCMSQCSKIITVNSPLSCSVTGASNVTTGTTNNQYTAPASMNSYSWTISGNGSIIGSTTGSSVNITAGAAGNFTLTLATTLNGCSSTCTKQVTVDPVFTYGCNLTGPSGVCNGSLDEFEAPTNLDDYAWTVSGNGFIVGSNTGSSVSVAATGNGSYSITLETMLNEVRCSSTKTVNVFNCASACTYTQGFYGNKKGKACFNGSMISSEQLMLIAFGPDDLRLFGSVSTNRYFTLYTNDITSGNIYKMLPGSGNSQMLGMAVGGATYNDESTWPLVPIIPIGRLKGKINNQLLAQVITLWFNIRTSTTLDGIDLSMDTLVTTSQTSCGSGILSGDPEKFGLPHSVIMYLNGGNGYTNNVNGLFLLANDVLGGANSAIDPNEVQNAVEAINSAFDGCRMLVGTIPFSNDNLLRLNTITLKPIIETNKRIDASDDLAIKVYPNPANSYFNIVVNSNNAKEKIVLQVFDQYGRSIETRANVSIGSTVRLGDRYRPGVYYVRVLQGKQHKEIKLIKLSD